MKFALSGTFHVVSETGLELGEVCVEVEDWQGQRWCDDLEALWQEYVRLDGDASLRAKRMYHEQCWRIFQDLSALAKSQED